MRKSILLRGLLCVGVFLGAQGFTCRNPVDPPPVCSSQCTAGAFRCSGLLVETCADVNDDGCTEYAAPIPCTSGSCSLGVCGDATLCNDECTNNGVAQCSGNSVQICGEFDGDDCLDLGPATNCTAPDTCSSGLCSPSCLDECVAGTVICVGLAGQRTCGEFDGDPCTDLSPPSLCPSGQFCAMDIGGFMSCQTCTDECDPTSYIAVCGGSDFSECAADVDIDPCYEVRTLACTECEDRMPTDMCVGCCPRCGDTVCDPLAGETACNCLVDCPAACGDGCCTAPEMPYNCCIDCPCTGFSESCITGTAGCVFSCPMIYSFDGETFAYETEAAGTSLIGSARHLDAGREREFAPLWVRLDRARVTWGADGRGSLVAKMLEGMDEITYLDEAHLTVVEHPAGYEVVSSSAVYWPTVRAEDPLVFWALRTAALRAPAHASWMGRSDVTAALATVEDVAVAHDRKADNWYELDFGPVRDPAHARLVIDGWRFKEVRDLPASVERRGPRIEVRGKDGKWHEVRRLAPPRGDRKAAAYDLGGIEWPEGRYRMRLVTGTDMDGMAMWYLDRARLIEEAPVPVRTYDLAPVVADHRAFGPPTWLDSPCDHTHPLMARDDGQGVMEMSTVGRYTRYGDVRPLLATSDDRFVIMGLGDGVELHFGGIAPVASGAAMSLFLASDLVYKPRVCAGCPGPTVVSESVAPLPFHGMVRYPPPHGKSYPADELHRKYLDEWNTREVVRKTGESCAAPDARGDTR